MRIGEGYLLHGTSNTEFRRTLVPCQSSLFLSSICSFIGFGGFGLSLVHQFGRLIHIGTSF
jgi:hypothetical protein